MAKSAIIQLPLFINTLKLKKHVLMFEKVIFIKENFEIGMYNLEMLARKVPQVFMRLYKSNKADVDFLLERNLLELISVQLTDFEGTEFEGTEVADEIVLWAKTTDKMFFDDDLNLKEEVATIENYDKFVNFITRVFSLLYSYKTEKDIIPIIDKFNSSNKTKKHRVYKFLLQSVPEPKQNVSWEQIIDFKNDGDAQKKYFRLINWINEVSRGELPVNEIEEKYKELLFEYSDMFRIHKMKYSLGTIELITKIVSEIGSLKFSNAHESFFSIFKQEVNLLEAETGFVGKEIAYVHKIQQNLVG